MKALSLLLAITFAATFAITGCSTTQQDLSGAKATKQQEAKKYQKQQADKANKELDKY